jgi:hypothetical protein
MAEWIFIKHGMDVMPLYAIPQPYPSVLYSDTNVMDTGTCEVEGRSSVIM